MAIPVSGAAHSGAAGLLAVSPVGTGPAMPTGVSAVATPTLMLVASDPGSGQAGLAGRGVVAGVTGLHAPGVVPGLVLVPTEQVLLLAVALPAMPAAQRRTAVGFAVEDRIAQPLDAVEVACGPQMSPGVWLVAVTARAVLAAHGAGGAALWPDALIVPVPRAGWAVWAGAGRAVVRLPDGTGFATQADGLPAFWTAAGSPDVTLFGGSLPAAIAIAAHGELSAVPDPALAGFDLRSGRRASGVGRFWPKGAGPLLAVLLAAAVGHLALLAADVAGLHRIAAQRQDALRAVLQAPAGTDLETALAQALAARAPADAGGVLDLLAVAFGAIGAEAGRVFVQEFRYAAADGVAVLTLEAPDLGTLQRTETALTAAGLTVTAGAATTRDGAAEVQMTLRGGGG